MSAIFGFEFTPHRVETASKKIHWKDVVARLLRLPWGKAYLSTPEPKPDKNALLADREKLSDEQQTAVWALKCRWGVMLSNEKVSDASDAFAAPLGSAVRSTTCEQSSEIVK